MKNKLALLVALAVVGTAATVFRSAGSQAQTSSPRDKFTFEGAAQRATADGQTTVELITSIKEIHVSSLDDALAKYSVVVAQPNYIQSLRDGDFNIITWNKMLLLETLSLKPYVAPCSTCSASPASPPLVYPNTQSDEIRVPERGGTIDVSGVTFVQISDIPFFTYGKKYVLFVNINPSNRNATVIGGGFEVAADGNTLLPLDTSDSPSPIITGVASRFNNSLSQLRAAF